MRWIVLPSELLPAEEAVCASVLGAEWRDRVEFVVVCFDLPLHSEAFVRVSLLLDVMTSTYARNAVAVGERILFVFSRA